MEVLNDAQGDGRMRRSVLLNCHGYSMLLALVGFCACGENGSQSGAGASASGATASTRTAQPMGGHGGQMGTTASTRVAPSTGGGSTRSNTSLPSGGSSSTSKSTIDKGGTAGTTKPDSYAVGGANQSTEVGMAGSAGETSEAFRVIGYEPFWSGDIEDIQYDKLTAVNYAFVLVNSDGSLQPVENVTKLDALVQRAHQHKVEVFISIGGWNDGDDSAFHALAGSRATREVFADEVLAFVLDHQLDGADIDWEYPDAGQSARDYTSLMTLLATRLHDAKKKLTAAVAAKGGAGIEDAVFAQVDYLNLMAYDGGDGAAHSPYSYAVESLDYWLNRGLPRHKCVLGVPFYGRPGWGSYANIVQLDPDAPNKDLSNGTYYNGIATIQAKTQLACERASGIMIWELSQDTSDSSSLLSAISAAIR